MNKSRISKKLVLVATLIFLCAGKSMAQYDGYKPVANLPVFRKQFVEESSKVISITSDFKQEKILMALTEKIISEGKFWFKRSSKVRIEYKKPFHYLMILNGDKMTVRDDQKQSQVNVKSSKLFQQINRIMIDCVQGTILESRDFTSRVFESEKKYLLEMTPVSKSLKEFFQTIVFTVEKKDFSASSIEMNEPGGDQTIITFTDKMVNGNVPENLFTP